MSSAAAGARGFAYLALLLLGAACAHLPAPPPGKPDVYRYVDRRHGVAVELPRGWQGFQRRAELPEGLREMIPSGFGPKPAMVGLRQGGLAFARVQYEPVLVLTTLEYFQALYQSTRDRLDVLEAAYSAEQDSVRWRYKAKTPAFDVTFVETLAVRRGTAIRVAFWTSSALGSWYAHEFASIAGEVLLYEGAGWSAPWRALDASLDWNTFQDLELAAPSEVHAAPECTGAPRGLLWKVRSERGALFLFPSLHVGHPDLFPLPAPVEAAFAASDRLAVEVDVGSSRFAEAMASVAARESSSGAELTPAQREQVAERLARLGLPLASFEHMPAWILAPALELLEWQSLGYFTEFGIEQYFLKRAGAKEVVELESAEEQTALLERVGAPMLDYTLRTLDELAGRIGPTVAAWYCGDDDAMARLVNDPGTAMPPELQKAVLDARNEIMAERLEPLLDRPGVTFATVGLGHFMGPRGLPALLEQRGHEVERQ